MGLNKLQQSIVDKFYKEYLDAKDFIGVGDTDDDAIKKYIERQVSKTTDEDELLKLSEKNASEFLEDIQFTRNRDAAKNPYAKELEFVNQVLDNKSNYSSDVVKQAQRAKAAIDDFRGSKFMSMAGVDAEQVEKAMQGINQRLEDADIPGLINKIGEEDRERKPLVTDESVAQDLEKEMIEGLPKDVSLPEGAKDEQIEFTDDELINIEEEEEEGEFIDTSAYQKKLEKQKRKQQRKEKIAQIAEGLGTAGKAAGIALMAGAGLKSMFEATREHDINKVRVSPLMQEAFQKAKTLSTQGLTYAERSAAMADLNNAYAGAMKNVMAVSGGQRSTALANMGVVDASRVNALVDLAGKDAALRRENMKMYQEQAKNIGQMQLSADSTNEQLRAQLEEGRKNRLTKIGDSLFSEATEFSRNFMDQRNNNNLIEMAGQMSGNTFGNDKLMNKKAQTIYNQLKEQNPNVNFNIFES